MTLIGKAYIKNPVLNSNLNIELYGASINMNWSMFTNTQDTPSRSVTDAYNDRLGKGIYTGFANPAITITGNYDVHASHVSGSTAVVDFEWLEELAKRGDQICVLTCEMFKTTSNSTGVKNIMIKGITTNIPYSNIVEYTLECVEVRS